MPCIRIRAPRESPGESLVKVVALVTVETWGDAKAIRHPPKTAAGMEWSQPETTGQATCATDGRAGKVMLPKPLGAQTALIGPRPGNYRI